MDLDLMKNSVWKAIQITSLISGLQILQDWSSLETQKETLLNHFLDVTINGKILRPYQAEQQLYSTCI